jgi:mitochondrial enoyl-[acyl-carrier protein] reductase / trans-2-enoyl-CoA reductase
MLAAMETALAARYHRTGSPADVLSVEPVSLTAPGPGEARVCMLWAPINPADLNMLEGKYGEARPLPDVPGNEGVGEVVSLGLGVDPSLAGRLVLVSREAWRAAGNWAADSLVPVPAGLDARQASMLRVNPPTAWLLLHDFARLQPGDWVVQNAASSGVGRAVIEIARRCGWKTLNLVRRAESAAELRSLGADAALVDGPDAAAEAESLLGGARPALGLNAVGGVSGTRVAGLLAPGGTLATYGAMSKESLKIPNGFLIFRDLVVRGFWLTRWLRDHPSHERDRVFGEVFRLAAEGLFRPRVAAEFPLARAAEAVALAAAGMPGGKVLLCLDA